MKTKYKKNIAPKHVFDGFCHRGYDESIDGWMTEQLDSEDVPSLEIARDIIILFNEVNELRRENWYLNKRLKERG